MTALRLGSGPAPANPARGESEGELVPWGPTSWWWGGFAGEWCGTCSSNNTNNDSSNGNYTFPALRLGVARVVGGWVVHIHRHTLPIYDTYAWICIGSVGECWRER
jgi:hypothetical protein